MANSPHPETVTVSFTLPRLLADAVKRRARLNLTNQSDIIRRALLAYIPDEEAQEIMGTVMREDVTTYKVTQKTPNDERT